MTDQPAGQPQETQMSPKSANGNGSQPSPHATEIPLPAHKQSSTPKSAKVERIAQTSNHKSTGPRTPQGKQRSKFNARKHDLFSKAVLLQDESRAEYESLLNGLREDLQPHGKLETVLVEKLAVVLWRQRRLLQVERAEIVRTDIKTADARLAHHVQALDYALPEGYFAGKPGTSSNLFILREAIHRLTKFQLAMEADCCEEGEKQRIRRVLFGLDQEDAARDRDVRECVEISRLTAGFPGAKEAATDPDQLKACMREALAEEVNRLQKLQDLQEAIELRKIDSSVDVARIPSEEVADRLLRYEAHLSREFDRTLTQLERLQRMRRGQPVLPPIKVDISS